MKKKEVLKEWNYKLNRLIEEKEYLEFDIAEDWLKRELKLNPYLQQNQKDVILFRERVYKDKFKRSNTRPYTKNIQYTNM